MYMFNVGLVRWANIRFSYHRSNPPSNLTTEYKLAITKRGFRDVAQLDSADEKVTKCHF